MKFFKTDFLKRSFFLLMLIPAMVFTQEFSDLNPAKQSNQGTGFLNSIMNPNRYTLNQSVSFSTTSGSGFSSSVGMFSNYLNYRINDKLNFNAGIHLIKPTYSGFPGAPEKPVVNFDFHLNYDYSENFKFQLHFVNMNPQYWPSSYRLLPY